MCSVFGGSLTGTEGRIASPLYPGLYPHGADYTWTVTVPLGRQIQLNFRDVDIDQPLADSCPNDYLQVTKSQKPPLMTWTY